MMSKAVSGNLISPVGSCVSYENPEYAGFIGIPRSSITAPGWGEPFFDENGAPIVPGTLGGKNQASIISNKDGVWGSRRVKRAQHYGEISWRGKKKNNTEKSKRYVISYHGPKTRHLPTPYFVYGSSASHRNVYEEGGLLGIAPGPVLGGCLRLVGDDKILYVVCLYEGIETVIKRVVGRPVYSTKEEDLNALASMSSDGSKFGWVVLGDLTVGDGSLPDTPWFFNESGTEGQCIRQVTKQGTFNGVSRDETARDRYKLLLRDDSFTLVAMGNDPAYNFKEEGFTEDKGLWVSTPDPYGFLHQWHELHLQVSAMCTGSQVVAVDYEGDEEVLVNAVIDVNYVNHQDYMRGTDDDYYADTPPIQRPLYMNSTYERYGNPYGLGVDHSATYGNHEGAMWFYGTALTYLSWTIGSVEYRTNVETHTTMNQTSYLKLPVDDTDKTLFYRVYEVQYIRHLDVRSGGVVSFCLDKYEHFVGQQTSAETSYEAYDFDFSDDKVTPILSGNSEQSSFNPTYHPMLNKDSRLTLDDMWDTAISWAAQPAWQWTATTWLGARPDDNDDASIGNLPINSWFPEQSSLFRGSWYGLKCLYHDKNTETASFCRLKTGEFMFSGELPDPDTGTPTSFLETSPDSLVQSVGSNVFFPIGEL